MGVNRQHERGPYGLYMKGGNEMNEAKAILGMMVALGFLLFGMTVLPRPGLNGAENIFAVLWLALILLSLAAFTREIWRVARLRTARRFFRGRGRGRSEAVFEDENAVLNRQRERRLY